MTAKPLTTENGTIKCRLKVGLVIVLALLGLLLQNQVFADGDLIDENFEGYNTADLSGQGNWSGHANFKVVETKPFTGVKSSYTTRDDTIRTMFYTSDNPASEGLINYRFWFTNDSAVDSYSPLIGLVGCQVSSPASCHILGSAQVRNDNTKWDFGTRVVSTFTATELNIPHSTWHFAEIEFSIAEWEFRVQLNGGGWSDWVTMAKADLIGDIVAVQKLAFYTARQEVWVDDFGTYTDKDFRVWGVSPASGTTIDDLSDEIVIGWEGFDEWYQDVYGKISVQFYNKKTGITLPAVWIEPATSTAGQETFTAGELGLDYANADWYLFARAISGYPWYLMTGDVVSPEYYVKVDVLGQEVLFEMSDWATWYAEKSDKYATSTEAFSTLAGLVEPIFSQIGSFGDVIIDFLDITEARETGENLAMAIPLLRQYVDEIENLFGGFPIIKIFLLCMVFIIGAFIVKLILKFIPFFG